MQKLPDNYNKIKAGLRKVAREYKVGIELAMLEKEGQVYIFKPLKDFNPIEPPRSTTQEDEKHFQNCFNKMSDVSEKLGFKLNLITLISNTRAKMLIGLFEIYQKYEADSNKITIN